MEYRLWVPLLIAITSVLVAGEYAVGEPASAKRTASTLVTAGDRASHAKPAEPWRAGKRPGCRRFCQQAGGFGAGDEPETMPVEVPSQKIDAPRKRIVDVSATCNLDTDCVGAILLNNLDIEYGRADLSIPAHTTSVVSVGVTRKGLRYLKDHGRDRKVFATVPLVGNDVVSIGDRLTLLAPR